jgi:hypothetical protein
MKKIVIILALVLTSTMTFAQDAPAPPPTPPADAPASKFTAAVDVVYPYLWRGFKLLGNKVAFQPYASYAFTDKFTFGVWGSTNFSNASDAYNEFDWYASYQVTPIVKVMLSDYYFDAPAARGSYFNYSLGGTQVMDLSLLLNFTDKGVPVDFQINTLVAGNDFNANGNRNFSTYSEIGYSHSIASAGIDLRAFVGALLNSDTAAYYMQDGFKFTNVGLNIAKSIKFSEKFSIPVFIRYTYNETGWVHSGELKRNFINGGLTFKIK